MSSPGKTLPLRCIAWLLLALAGCGSLLRCVLGASFGASFGGSFGGSPGGSLGAAPVLDLAHGCFAAAWLILAQLGLGRSILALEPFASARVMGLSRRLFSYALGTQALAVLLLGLSLLKWLGPTTAWLLAALLTPWVWSSLRLLPRTVPRPTWKQTCFALTILVLALPYVVQTLLPDHDWDGPSYHMPTARALAREGAWFTEPHLPQCNFPATVHLGYAWLLALDAKAAVMPWNHAVSLLVVLAAGALAHDLFGKRAGWFAAAVAASNNLLLELGLDPRIDEFIALWIVNACHALLLLWRDPGRRGLLPIGGACLGLALGAKYTAVIFVLLLGAPALWIAWRARLGLAILALAAACTAVPGAFWYLRNHVALGDACYPFLFGRVLEQDGQRVRFQPAIDALIDRAGMPPPEFMPQPANATPPPHNFANPLELFVDPDRYETKPLHWISPFVLGFLMLPFVRRERSAWQLTILCLLAGLAFVPTPPTSRYVVPVLMLMSAAAGAAIASLARPRLRVACAVLLGLLIARGSLFELRKLVTLRPLEWICQAIQWERNPTATEWKHIARLEPWRYLLGRETEAGLLARVGYNRDFVVPNVAAFVAQEVRKGRMQPSDTLLMVGEDKADGIEMQVLRDTSREGYRFLVELLRCHGDHDRLAQRLAARGVQYLLYNHNYFAWCRLQVPWTDGSDLNNYRYLRFSLWQLERFLERRGTQIFKWKTFVTLYRLRLLP